MNHKEKYCLVACDNRTINNGLCECMNKAPKFKNKTNNPKPKSNGQN